MPAESYAFSDDRSLAVAALLRGLAEWCGRDVGVLRRERDATIFRVLGMKSQAVLANMKRRSSRFLAMAYGDKRDDTSPSFILGITPQGELAINVFRGAAAEFELNADPMTETFTNSELDDTWPGGFTLVTPWEVRDLWPFLLAKV